MANPTAPTSSKYPIPIPLSNLAEITPVVIGDTPTQTNPLDPDTDHDGLSDKWERDHGLAPTDAKNKNDSGKMAEGELA